MRWCFWNLEIILSSLLNRSTLDSDRGHPWHMGMAARRGFGMPEPEKMRQWGRRRGGLSRSRLRSIDSQVRAKLQTNAWYRAALPVELTPRGQCLAVGVFIGRPRFARTRTGARPICGHGAGGAGRPYCPLRVDRSPSRSASCWHRNLPVFVQPK